MDVRAAGTSLPVGRVRQNGRMIRTSSLAAGAAAVFVVAAFLVDGRGLVAFFCVMALLCLGAWWFLDRRGS